MRGLQRSGALCFSLCVVLTACETLPCDDGPVVTARVRFLPIEKFEAMPMTLNGKLIEGILDTGAEETTFETNTYLESIGERSVSGPRLDMFGTDGKTPAMIVDADIEIAGVEGHDAPIVLVSHPLFHDRRLHALIGADYMYNWDLDLDLGKDRAALDRPQLCGPPVPPWQGATTRVATFGRPWMIVPVVIDGHPMRALLDTGASRSLITEDSDAGRESVPGDRLSWNEGINHRPRRARIHHFGAFSIGGRPFGAIDALVTQLDEHPGFQMILGLDVLKAVHVYMAFQAHQLLIENDTP